MMEAFVAQTAAIVVIRKEGIIIAVAISVRRSAP
jgi:hypothetical protein